jgi:hypothetical protein
MKYIANYTILFGNEENKEVFGVRCSVQFSGNTLPRVGECMIIPDLCVTGDDTYGIYWSLGNPVGIGSPKPGHVTNVYHHNVLADTKTFVTKYLTSIFPFPKHLSNSVDVLVKNNACDTVERSRRLAEDFVRALKKDENVSEVTEVVRGDYLPAHVMK